jgi:peptide/nickel transport system permease protein/oligopeptide transport system permease protein
VADTLQQETPPHVTSDSPSGRDLRAGRISTWRKLCGNRTTLVALVILVVMIASAFLIPPFFPEAAALPSDDTYLPPLSRASDSSFIYLLGTDINGTDLLYRVLAGARVSLLVGLAGATVALFIGAAYGTLAGFLGGRVEAAMMRTVDILYSIPRVLFIMIFIAAFDSRLKSMIDSARRWASDEEHEWLHDFLEAAIPYSRIVILILSLGLIEWLTMARIVRGQVLVLREQQFVTASRALGQRTLPIIGRHILPNLAGIILTYLTLTVPAVILDESFLSFLGLGIDDPASSWGSLLRDGAQVINPLKSQWWLLLFPALAMGTALLCLNFLGDGLRDALDVRNN